jgi:hypothetical protein
MSGILLAFVLFLVASGAMYGCIQCLGRSATADADGEAGGHGHGHGHH